MPNILPNGWGHRVAHGRWCTSQVASVFGPVRTDLEIEDSSVSGGRGSLRRSPPETSVARRPVRRRTLPGNPASAVYGTVLVAGQLAVESASDRSTAQTMLGLVGTVLVFWIVHAYTDSLGAAISADDSGTHSLRHTLRAEWPIVESGALPAVILLVAAVAGADPSTGALFALITAAVELVGWALLAARRAGLSGIRRFSYTAVAGLLGVLIIALKYALH